MEKTIKTLERELDTLKLELKNTQKALDKYKSISCFGVDDLPDPVIFYDLKNRPVYCNRFFTDVFGWNLSDFHDPNFTFIPPEKKKEADSLDLRISQGEIIRSFETSRTAKSGEIIHIRISAAINRDSRGNPIGRVVIYRDIRQKKKFKDLLIESEEKYRTLMEAIADPVIVYDMQGRVTYFNPAFSRVFKWSLPECLNKKMENFVPDENWPETKKMIQLAVGGKFFSGVETRRYDKHGNIVPVVISGSTFRDKNNNIIGSIINFQDISERKKAEKTIKEKDKLEGILELAGAVCHELSQPAMIIEGYADLLSMNLDKDNPLRETIPKLKNQIRRIAELSQKLMNVTTYKTMEYSKGRTIVDIDRSSKY